MDLSKVSTAELEEELERREEEEKRMPLPLADIDVGNLEGVCVGVIQEMADGDWHEDNDDEHYVYECAMETVFGKAIWAWMDSNT